MKTAMLEGPALDWAVAKCEGKKYSSATTYDGIGNEYPPTLYSTDDALSSPIIDHWMIGTHWSPLWQLWVAPDKRNATVSFVGKTRLIAAMRCYVASKLGDEVEIPEELK